MQPAALCRCAWAHYYLHVCVRAPLCHEALHRSWAALSFSKYYQDKKRSGSWRPYVHGVSFLKKGFTLCVQCLASTYVHLCIPGVRPPEASAVSTGAKATASCEAPCGCWGLNSGPIQENTCLIHGASLFRKTLSHHKQAVCPGKLHAGCHGACKWNCLCLP